MVDASVVLVVLAAVVVVDTLAILTLLVLTVRWHQASLDREPMARSTRTETLTLVATSTPGSPAQPAADARSVAQPSVADARPAADATQSGATDPLADAITEFLGRADGIFRAGGPRPPADPAAGPGPTALPADAPASTGTVRPPVEPGPPAVLERAGSEVTWAPARPVRYVPSGPRPGREAARPPAMPPSTAGPAVPPAPDPPTAITVAPPPAVPPTGLVASSPAIDPAVRAIPTSRLSVTLAGDPAVPETSAAVARLGPVIGGLLRERTRLGDVVSADAAGRFTALLPGTSTSGAEALADRLVASCEAWLGAERPALRLAIEIGDHDGPVAGPAPDRGRAEGPDRRRRILQDA